jgi:DsbC/DsbD-like thiol-disulfide interchange protein
MHVMRLRFLMLLAALLAPAVPARAASSDTRLLAGGLEPAGTLLAGIEIRFPGAKTYWRNPGDSGIAPRFDWSGSVNVGRAEVLWPAPLRFEDGEGWSIGYKDHVLLPVRVTPARPGAPVSLRLRMDYGICEKLCVPAHADAHLPLTAVGPDRARIAQALAAVPRPLPLPAPDGAPGVRRVGLEGEGAAARLVVDTDLPPGAGTDLFVEGPDGWAGPKPEAAEVSGHVRFTVPAGDLRAGPDTVLTLTTVGPGGAVEQRWRLDAAPAK